uniref:BH4_AAA_HYDROXYL_2 domain-containing protein n=1 Tax=Steinernema glaseri TaxID=37863 RepID=A0A1I7Y488_9BILA
MSDVTAVKPEWFGFKLPPVYSVDIDREYKNFVLTDREAEASMIERIKHTYNPRTYGPCPLEAHRALRNRLKEERQQKSN